MLNMMLMINAPNKITAKVNRVHSLTIPNHNKNMPTIILKNAQRIFVIGDDKPFPGGLAKGVGNLFPDIP